MFRFKHLGSAPIENEVVYRYHTHPDWLAQKESWEIENFVAQEFKTDNEIALTGKMQWGDLGVVDFYMWLAYTSGLGLNAYLPVTVEDSGEIDLPFDQLSQPSEDGISIFDVLGTYNPQNHHVTMYTKLIETAAGELGVNYDVLYQVVLVHELAHAVTHLAYDETGEVWSWFSLAKTEAKELLAQILPFITFRECKMLPHLRVMNQLSQHQPALYNEYKKYEAASLDEVRGLVEEERTRLELRRTSDVSFQIDLRCSLPGDGALTHIFQDRRILGNFGPGATRFGEDQLFQKENTPYVENQYTKFNCMVLPNLLSERTIEELNELGRLIMPLEEEEFQNVSWLEKGILTHHSSIDISITIDGFTRVFSNGFPCDRPWGNKRAAFEGFLARHTQAIQEAEGLE